MSIIKPTEYLQYLTPNEVKKLTDNNCIIDASAGGLILGPSHRNGGVFMLYKYPQGYRAIGEIEGYEYVIKKEAASKFRMSITEINNQKRDFISDFDSFDFNIKITTIDTFSTAQQICHAKFLLMDFAGGWAIINKHSTKIFLKQIEEINNYVG